MNIKKHFSEKASFFIPEGIRFDLIENGNRERYDKQKTNFRIEDINEPELIGLIEMINIEKKGLDQEYYI